ncbi:GntR family transcriptional regulator [Thermanaerothrix sp. 4228-RoL]|uniref:GntR family transcriptional regulator n=1 Tax=Thermanaerothrix solaris TaxID=3058434 RepID=A0ABU3NMN7_9CHLR|nr:GntR family transcriptional regulator [Thermanaerothrix sp. 4228-RoL]MDT8898118.1 GntR family transcriptional regulator [Thermanaerothrix sp. 4228-RoL]
MLNANSPIPLYYQLKSYLQDQILQGLLKPGERIPTEKELGERFKISRTTVRQAIGDLINEGLLVRVHGKGTFVAQPRIQQHLGLLTSFTQDMEAHHRTPSSQVLQFEVLPAPPPVARALQIKIGTAVIMLKRVRLADGQPLALEIAYLPEEPFRPLLDLDMSQRSLYATLKAHFGVEPQRALQQMEAVACPAEEARFLQVNKGSPILHIFRTTFDQSGRPFEFVESYYRSDRFFFTIEIWSR